MTGEARRALWLLGADIAKSPSPAMHNAGLAALGVDAVYGLRPCSREALDATLDEAERVCLGINVTAPHKRAVADRYAAALDEVARRAGASNTVAFRPDGALATNTDVHGLLVAWRRASVFVEDRTVAILGAGGAARAVVVALADAGARGILVLARRPEAADDLCALAERERLRAETLGARAKASMLVVASPEVPAPHDALASALVGPGVVHDLRYGAKTRPLRDAALRSGHLYLDGTSMLLAQGIRSLEAFLGRSLSSSAKKAMAGALARAARFEA